ncbi:hypothetical protein EDB85DRAFT_1029949 [Lactarius pseudohatsudake]|nr:hypothetical protein EDB85DRAFT_1029949 [Lactarius pseudohatsudake]
MFEFVVWDKDLVRNDFLGGKSLPINDWFKGTVFTFDDPNNRVRPLLETRLAILAPLPHPFSVDISSTPAQTMRGTGTIILIPIPQPLSFDHISSPPTPTVRGPTIRTKLGFVYSTGQPIVRKPA